MSAIATEERVERNHEPGATTSGLRRLLLTGPMLLNTATWLILSACSARLRVNPLGFFGLLGNETDAGRVRRLSLAPIVRTFLAVPGGETSLCILYLPSFPAEKQIKKFRLLKAKVSVCLD